MTPVVPVNNLRSRRLAIEKDYQWIVNKILALTITPNWAVKAKYESRFC
jgi:hypothetical protein